MRDRAEPVRKRRLGASALCLAALAATSGCGDGAGGPGGGAGGGDTPTGRGGSTARMAIDGDYLYAISGSTVQLFDLATPAAPQPWTRVELADDIQSLFPHGDHLIVGGLDGVYVMDNTDPAAPRRLAVVPHVTATDPVVAQGPVAYASMRADFTRPPPASEDRLEVLDLSDPAAPTVVSTVSMQAPAGLAVRGDRLHVCDGEAGLKTFDLADPVVPRAIGTVAGEDCNDMILADDLLHVVSDDGLRQYDLTTGRPLLLSEIGRAPVVYVVDR